MASDSCVSSTITSSCFIGQIGNRNAADLGRLQSFFGEGRDLVAELDDVDLFAAQFADDGLHAHALHAHAGAHGVHVLVAALHRDLGALAGLARNGADNHGVVVDLGNLRLEEVLHQFRRGAAHDHLRSLGGAVHLEQHHAHALAYGELLQPRLLALGAARLGFAQVVDDVLALDALDRRVQDFFFAVRVFLEDRVALGLADLLEDDLLGQLRGDAAQRAGVAIDADFAAHFHARRQLIGLGQRDLVDRILDLILVGDHCLVDVGRNLAGLLVQFPAHVFLGLVVLARGQGDGLLDRADNDAGVDALLLAQELDALIQNVGGHTLLALFSFPAPELRAVAMSFFRC